MEVQTKCCTHCQMEQPLSEYYVDRRSGTHWARCRSCSQLLAKRLGAKRRETNPSIVDTPEWIEREKKCSKCKSVKKFTEFVRNIGGKDGLGKVCRPCAKRPPEVIKLRNRKTSVRYSGLKANAKKRGIVVMLTLDEYSEKVSGCICHYCNGPLELAGGGLDRIGNEPYYSVANTVPCCVVCNMVKSDVFTYDEMVVLGRVIRNLMDTRVTSGETNNIAA